QRYLSMTEFTQAVETTAKPRPAAEPVTPSREVQRPTPAPKPEPATPAGGPPSSAALLGELFGSMVLAGLFRGLATALGAAIVPGQSAEDLGAVFFLTVAASWAVLVPAKFWTRPLEESLSRRTVQMLLGVAVGAVALWVEGWTLDGGVRVRDGVTASVSRSVPLQPSLVE